MAQSNCIIPFRPFSRRAETQVYYHGRLPHWRQSGCTYFITFRLGDSLPQSYWAEFEEQRNIWLIHHGIDPEANSNWKEAFLRLPGKELREYETHFGALFSSRLDRGYGSCLVRQPEVAALIGEALQYFHGDRVWTGDFVAMPNHVHALMTPIGKYAMEDILHSVKSYTSHEINKLANRSGPLWSKESYDHIVRDGEQLTAFQKYIRNNPVKAGIENGFLFNGNEVIYELKR